jgi:hypothetical protein
MKINNYDNSRSSEHFLNAFCVSDIAFMTTTIGVCTIIPILQIREMEL